MSSFVISNETIATTEQNPFTDVATFLNQFIAGDIDESEFSNLLDMHIELSSEY